MWDEAKNEVTLQKCDMYGITWLRYIKNNIYKHSYNPY